MVTCVDLATKNGSVVRYGVIAIFTLDDSCYMALIPMRDDETPADADVALYACEPGNDEGDEYSLVPIEGREEHEAAASAFREALASF